MKFWDFGGIFNILANNAHFRNFFYTKGSDMKTRNMDNLIKMGNQPTLSGNFF